MRPRLTGKALLLLATALVFGGAPALALQTAIEDPVIAKSSLLQIGDVTGLLATSSFSENISFPSDLNNTVDTQPQSAANKLLALAKPVDDSELSEMRGGFFTASGAQFDFGANVQTLVNGQLALQSNLTWTSAGPIVQNLLPNEAALANAAAPITQGIGITVPASALAAATGMGVSATPSGNSLSFVANPNGVTVQSPTGTTQVLTNLNDGMLQNLIVNSASNQTLTQATNIQLTIYNFADWQQQLARASTATQLAAEVMAASGLGGGR